MPGIEQFPVAAEVVLTDEERLMAVFSSFAIANTAEEEARARVTNLSIRAENLSEEFHAYEPALKHQNRQQYLYELGGVTDKIYTLKKTRSEMDETTTQARRDLIRTAQEFCGRKLHVVSLLPEDSRQPIGALARSRHDYTGPVIIDDLREAVGKVGHPAIDGDNLDLVPLKPKHVGIKRLTSFAVRMVGPNGKPLVKLEFLD